VRDTQASLHLLQQFFYNDKVELLNMLVMCTCCSGEATDELDESSL